ncbi:hypothetical protein Misp01_77650 [Microtetraspora sp. NBRC 13810]|uniref:RICIN domain-containing protein n=1 Tax=Microtetraspora sp. NBRC 13810 TaxID=3030990 RepID=UPI0024A106B4|nr:RICIN domain-containing protein [Microtetraspora sp. NBRC 13810]GLW12637.1 hypothetical protein Misp01_77650 [Microtetraspora sp. NBRC 13810]
MKLSSLSGIRKLSWAAAIIAAALTVATVSPPALAAPQPHAAGTPSSSNNKVAEAPASAPTRPASLGPLKQSQLEVPGAANPINWVRITNRFSGRVHASQCLDVDINAGGANGSKVQVWQCNGSQQQLWFWWLDGYLESARFRGKCLDADLIGGGANGTRLQLWSCNGSSQQVFWMYANDLAIYNERFYGGGNTVADRNATIPGNGAQVQLWQKNFQSQQWWSVTCAGNTCARPD